jgi:heme exporter protein A
MHPNAGVGTEPMPWAPGDSKALVARDNLLTGLQPASGQTNSELNFAGLQAVGLASLRSERLVFASVDLAVDAGEALVLMGPNGSGKSTLMRLLAGLKQPDAGTVFWDGGSVTDDLEAYARRVAYVGHLDGVKPGLNTRENLAFAAKVGGGNVDQALASFGLSAYAAFPARMLSAGQRRRLALARLMLKRAPLWLLDEPTVGLDAASIGLFGKMLAEHRARGGVVVAATHVPLPLPRAKTLDLA